MSDAICDPQDAEPAYRSRAWAWNFCIVSLVPVLAPPKVMAPSGEPIGPIIALFALLLLLPAIWPTAFPRYSALNQPILIRSYVLSNAIGVAASYFAFNMYTGGFCFWTPACPLVVSHGI